MKKVFALMITMLLTAALVACAPEVKDSISVGPDFSPNTNPVYEFPQLHNDTLSQFSETPQYHFITDCDISGSNEDKLITVKAVCYDDADAELVSHFAAALLRRINDAACIQNNGLKISDSTNFGDLWKTYGFELSVYTESENAKEKPTALYELKIEPGKDSGLDPDIETYEQEWNKQLEIIQRNEQ